MEVGDSIEVEYTITSVDLAKSLSISEDDDFPDVLATSRMIALMELAAARLMKPKLKDGELSVGVNVNVNHLAATPNSEIVKAVAEYTGMNGKLFSFKVYLFDRGGKAGDGVHTRAIISTSRLLEGANKRVKA